MRAPRGIALVLVVAAGMLAAGVAAAQDAPGQLWEESPLVPAEPIPALEEPLPPVSGVAGVQAGGPAPGAPAGDLVTPIGPDDPLGVFPLELLLTGLVSAILLLGAAALPRASARGPTLLGLVAGRRLELTLAGATLLLVTTLVYAASAA
jgi:hypothetical protein